MYPAIDIPRIKNPKRFYAIPLVGGLVKIIMIIPILFWLMLLGIASIVMAIINSFIVLFTGKYWQPFYEISVFTFSITVKLYFFLSGLSNNYPGFNATTKDFTLTIPLPEKPNMFFAFPILGGLARFILLFPYIFYNSIIQQAANIGTIVASFPVLFAGNYPESLYELNRDSVRVNIAMLMYFVGLSDKYPSWWISMNHKAVKITLIVLALIFYLFNQFIGFSHKPPVPPSQQYQFQHPSPRPTY